ncbi:hypothetical protein [Escherichia coli]|uniref:hypothetical protein n=1 Tax=Escherichia coli TaxID=562 RepID=UPI0021575251|nr:hypothetical protein [Escherichia coli]
MNKKILVSLIAGTVMMSTSIASMAAANPVGTHNTTVSGSFVSPTCMVTEWPQDISFDPISIADWANYNIQETVQVKSQGQFVLTGCPANTAMKYSVTAETLTQGNVYQALAKDADDGQTLNGIGISFSASENGATTWRLDGTEANMGTTDSQGGLSVPAFALLKKRSSIVKNNQAWNGGNFNQVNTYSISYD